MTYYLADIDNHYELSVDESVLYNFSHTTESWEVELWLIESTTDHHFPTITEAFEDVMFIDGNSIIKQFYSEVIQSERERKLEQLLDEDDNKEA